MSSAEHQLDTTPPKMGLVAGWGRYPLVLAESLRQQGYQVFGVGIHGHAPPALKELCHSYCEAGLARLGAHIRFFRRQGVQQITMAGKIHKRRLLEPNFIWKHLPDWSGVRTYCPHFVTGSRDRNDDTLLHAMIAAYARYQIVFVPATDYAPQLLAPVGRLAGTRITTAQQRDIDFGWRLAKAAGGLDIGQSVAVKGQAVLAVEAVEGTDACIRRAGVLCKKGGFTLVKVAKPQQDMRFDVPTVGIGTVKAMAKSGGRVLAIEAGRTIIIDREQVVEFANRHNIQLVAYSDVAMGSHGLVSRRDVA